jgi:AcrR family transcriptional regulator
MYRQSARAASTRATRAAILDAVDELFLPAPGRRISLEDVAALSGTTVQTVLRHFGTKSGLIGAAAARGLARTQAGRDAVPAGDLRAVSRYLGQHYEEVGRVILRIVAAEDEDSDVGLIARDGREMHSAWVQRVLAPLIEAVPPSGRERRLATLVAVTDLLAWKVLRLEQGLSQRDYVRSVHELLEGLQ